MVELVREDTHGSLRIDVDIPEVPVVASQVRI
jgi:hypothetical protein